MPTFKDLDGQTLQYGEQGTYLVEDEKAFILKLDAQLRAADLNNQEQVSSIQSNMNEISAILGLGKLPENGIIGDETAETLNYFNTNRELFIQHGITNHLKAIELAKMEAPAFTPTEYAPTMDEMLKLEVDIGRLYDDEG